MTDSKREASECKNYKMGKGICFTCFEEAIQRAEQRGEKKAVSQWGTSYDYRRGLLRGAEIAEEEIEETVVVPCPDGQVGCCVVHYGTKKSKRHPTQIAEAIRKEANNDQTNHSR